MEIKESGQMYLENILILSKSKEIVRAIDVSEFMGYSKPSVSRALSVLKNEGYITVSCQTGAIILTDKGFKLAQSIFDRHQTLKSFFIKLGVDERIANQDACRIEHVISEETFQAIKRSN